MRLERQDVGVMFRLTNTVRQSPENFWDALSNSGPAVRL